MLIEVVTDPGVDDMAMVKRGMRESGRTVTPDGSNDISVGAFARSAESRVVGGINASVGQIGLEIDALWVDDAHRGNGVGAKLLSGVEDFARSHGAGMAFLTTVESRDFYEENGYTVYAQLEGPGAARYHMKKDL
jgi:GNAT superfamily N-acetyltransferase